MNALGETESPPGLLRTERVGLVLLIALASCHNKHAPTPPSEPVAPEVALRQAPQRLANGESASCAIRADGSVWCWGDNNRGQLGVAGAHRTTPVRVPGLDRMTQVTAARFHACALGTDGSVWCWGDDTFGRVSGDPTGLGIKGPTRVAGLDRAQRVALGENHSCALLGDGSVWCWGRDAAGELGDGKLGRGDGEASGPVRVAALGSASSVTAFGTRTAAIVAGRLWWWGAGAYRLENWGASGVLRPPPITPEELPPRPMTGLKDVERVVLGRRQGLALLRNGSLMGFGDATRFGAMLDGSSDGVNGPPFPFPPLGEIVDIATGDAYSCVLLRGGQVRCWGADRGPLASIRGDGQHDYRLAPSTLPLNATAIAGGSSHVTAACGDQVLAWGSGEDGQLGQGTTSGSAVPVGVRF